MMRRAVVMLSLVVLTGAVALPAPAAATIVAPPAINLPAGGKVVTEINLSDDDVLGIVKASIPAIADALKTLAPAMADSATALPSWATAVNFDEFSEAISGVHRVRFIVARYSAAIKPEKFIEQFSAGVAKVGQFNKVVSDFGSSPGAVGLYAAPDNAGMIGFAYDPRQRTAYALRIVGGVDVPKLIHWAGEIARTAVAQPKKRTPEPATLGK